MKGKKILLLGGSPQQVPVISRAKELGLETILIDYLPDNPGKEIAHKWYQESTTDIETVYRIAREEAVAGILAYASDPAALPAAIVAERLELPTNPAKSVEILGVKNKFRKFLRDNGFDCPGFIEFPADIPVEDLKKKLENLSFPIVIKPTDSSGSKGVTKISDLSHLGKALDWASQYSKNKILIAEEFIERGFPYLIGGDIFVEDSQIVLKGEMACIRDEKNSALIPVGKKWPSGLSESQRDKIYNLLQDVIKSLGIKTGEFNIEIILGKDDTPYLLELGPRAGGNMIPIQLSDIYSVDLITSNIKAALGGNTEIKPVEPQESFMTHVVHSNRDGIFRGIDFSEEIKPHIYRMVIYKKPGDVVEAFDGAGKALGILFMKFENEEQTHGFLREIEKHIRLK